jgi:hypothetical protein
MEKYKGLISGRALGIAIFSSVFFFAAVMQIRESKTKQAEFQRLQQEFFSAPEPNFSDVMYAMEMVPSMRDPAIEFILSKDQAEAKRWLLDILDQFYHGEVDIREMVGMTLLEMDPNEMELLKIGEKTRHRAKTKAYKTLMEKHPCNEYFELAMYVDSESVSKKAAEMLLQSGNATDEQLVHIMQEYPDDWSGGMAWNDRRSNSFTKEQCILIIRTVDSEEIRQEVKAMLPFPELTNDELDQLAWRLPEYGEELERRRSQEEKSKKPTKLTKVELVNTMMSLD